MVEVDVADASAVAEARRKALEQADAVALGELRSGELAIVVTELATNLLKHAGRGKLVLGAGEAYVDVLSLDRGPGMADVSRCLADGYSSAGTPGNGLGAVRRLAQGFDIASWPGVGTAVFARVARADAPAFDDRAAAVDVPMAGEAVSGDGWALQRDGSGCTLFMVDGLGHGTEAALAAHEAVRQFRRSAHEAPSAIVQSVHLAMRHTRGGAVAAARIEHEAGTVVYAGLGNIAAALAAPSGLLRRLVSLNGTAGHNARKIQSFEYPYGQGDSLILHTDGIGSNWTLDRYPGFSRLHPMLLAGLLLRDHSRGRDDATVLVARTAA